MLHFPGVSQGRRRARRRVPGVVFFHGFTGDRMESHWIFVKCARALAKAGIASLRFDFYGSGESEGEYREASLRGEIADARAAVNFFRCQGIDADRLGLLGLSLGGVIAAILAPDCHARALVLWSAPAHPSQLRTLAKTSTVSIPGRGDLREYAAHEVSPRFLGDLDKIQPLESIARFQAPTLIIHPEKDEYFSLADPEDYIRAAGAAIKEKVIVQGADHTFSSILWEREVISRTMRWFRKYLAT
jgi:uncharacterized protein